MLIRRLEHVAGIILRTLAVAAVLIPFVSPTVADAAERSPHPAKKHKPVVKKSPHRVVKAAKLNKAHPPKVAQERKPAQPASMKAAPAALTLAKDLEFNSTAASSRQAQVSRPALNEADPPLQIGKTLYERNGEIRLRETEDAPR